MRCLIIKELGPIKEATINLGRFNLIIGRQSSGKSTVIKTACYCAWVEKYIEMNQSADYYLDDNYWQDAYNRYKEEAVRKESEYETK